MRILGIIATIFNEGIVRLITSPFVLIATGFLFFFGLVQASAGETAREQVQKRWVLAPWSSVESEEIYFGPVMRHLESVLNTLGVLVDYVDLDTEKLPDPTTPQFKEKYLGVVSCFENEKISKQHLWRNWLEDFSKTQLPWVALGDLGLLEGETHLSQLFRKFGVTYNASQDNSLLIQEISRDRAEVGFERQPGPVFRQYIPVVPLKENHPVEGLRLKSGDGISIPVFTANHMSLAYGDYGLYSDISAERRQWVIDPFIFFGRALHLSSPRPIPDVAVLNGNRVFFTHADGDAFNSISNAYPGHYNGESIAHDIVQKYPDLPFGISIIVAEIDPTCLGSPALEQVAKNILALPNVEPASHTTTHPLDWTGNVTSYGPKSAPIDLHLELEKSIAYLQTHVVGTKKIESLYWSGNCLPSEKAIAELDTLGYLNINGGDSRCDTEYPSIAYLSPLGRKMGNHFQVFSGNANDNIYTDGWAGKFYAFKKVTETYQCSDAHFGKPLGNYPILKPVDSYFHFFSGERPQGISAIQTSLDWARAHSISPIFPSVYIRSVMGYRSAIVSKTDDLIYELHGAQGLHTLRIDNETPPPGLATNQQDGLVPNISKSRGLLGYHWATNAVYIHLDPAANGEAHIELRKVNYGSENSTRPFIDSVGGLINSASFAANKIHIVLAPFARGPIVINTADFKTAHFSAGPHQEVLAAQNHLAQFNFQPQAVEQQIEVSLEN